MTSSTRTLTAASLLLVAASLSAPAFGQQTAQSLPEAPGVLLAANQPASTAAYSSSVTNETTPGAENPQSQTPAQAATTPAQPEHQDGQTSRILGIIPNFRAVSADVHLPPQSIKEKFITASQDSFDYSSIVLPALLAGFNQARNQTPEFRQGGIGYGRYLWHSTLDQTSENYFVEFIVPAIAHEDTRYYTLGHGGFSKRVGYSISRIVITRNDAGKEVFNSGEVLGAGMAAALSNAYYPQPERTFSNTAQQWGTSVGIDAFTFVFKEFWPDINHKLFHGKD
jgi:hypothetical protein